MLIFYAMLKTINLSESLKQAALAYLKSLNYRDALRFKRGGRLVPRYKNGSGIHIKKENRGKFTASAKRAGQSVQEHARSVLNNPNATPLQKKRANFARNAAKWKHRNGGIIRRYNNINSEEVMNLLRKTFAN